MPTFRHLCHVMHSLTYLPHTCALTRADDRVQLTLVFAGFLVFLYLSSRLRPGLLFLAAVYVEAVSSVVLMRFVQERRNGDKAVFAAVRDLCISCC